MSHCQLIPETANQELSMRLDLTLTTRHLIPETSAVYAIRHIASGQLYIGSTRNLRKRITDHAKCMRRNAHTNIRLNALAKAHPLDAFIFHVVEWVTGDMRLLLRRESQFIRQYDSYRNGLNLAPRASGHVWSEKSKKQHAEKISRTFTLQKDGKIFEGKNLSQFARAHGLEKSTLNRVLNGKRPQYRGWTLPGVEVPCVFVKDPDGVTHKVLLHQKKAFCRDHGISWGLFRSITQSKNVMHKGWSHVDADFKTEERKTFDQATNQWKFNTYLNYSQKPFRLMKDGVVYEGENIAEFARKVGLRQGALNAVVSGEVNQCYGWSLPNYVQPASTYVRASDGQIFEIKHQGLTAFYSEHRLVAKSFRKLLRGKVTEYRGWTLSDLPAFEAFSKKAD